MQRSPVFGLVVVLGIFLLVQSRSRTVTLKVDVPQDILNEDMSRQI